MGIKISVIIPTYNRGRFIGTAVESVLKQSLQEIECIVVDDGSVDDTETVISRFADSRLKYIKLLENRGACHARNVGIAKAQGECIAFQDSDDIWEADKLEKQYQYLKECNSDMVFCQLECFDRYKNRRSIFPARDYGKKKIDFYTALEKAYGSTQTFLIRKKCFETVSFDEKLSRFQDWDLSIQMAGQYDVRFMKEVLVRQRISKDSISRNDRKGRDSCIYLYHKYKEFYEAKPSSAAFLMELTGIFQAKSGLDARNFFWKAVVRKPWEVKYWIRLFLSVTGCMNFIYRQMSVYESKKEAAVSRIFIC